MMRQRLLKFSSILLFVIVFGATVGQGIVSSYRLYPSALPGYWVQPFDSTIMWAGTRALFLQGISPYSPAGDAIVQTLNFGRPLQPGDEKYAKDEQRFAYPLHIALLYLPTIGLNFSDALVVLAFSFYASFLVAVWLWFRLLNFPRDPFARVLLLAVALTLPATYSNFQGRQPALWVFVLLTAAIVLMQSNNGRGDFLVGLLLAWSTIKPQSSLLVIAYIVIVYLGQRGLKRSLGFLAGLGGTGLLLLLVTQAILPGWVPEFWNALRDYRGYAGATGAENLFGVGSPAAQIVSAVCVLIWLAQTIYMLRQREWQAGHLIVLATGMLVQVFIFPTHPYNFIFAIPLWLLGLKFVWQGWTSTATRATVLLTLLLTLSVYLAYLVWFTILQADSSGAVAALSARGVLATLRSMLPGKAYWMPAVGILLGWVMWGWQVKVRHSLNSLNQAA